MESDILNEGRWNKCDYCGKFIKFEDFVKSKAIRRYKLDYYGDEDYDTVCPKHKQEYLKGL